MRTAGYAFGMGVGAMLGILLAALSMYVLSLPIDSWGALNALIIAVVAGGPLLLLLLGATVSLLRTGARARQLLVIWLPVLLGGGILPASGIIDSIRLGSLSRLHPPVVERHINLTGSTISVAKYTELDGATPAHFEEERRFPAFKSDAYWRSVYSGHRLAPGFISAPVQKGPPNNNVPEQLPVVLANAYPDFRAIHEESEPLFLYYYYPDRVEVAPTSSISLQGLKALAARGQPVLHIFTHNLGQLHIVRLEIDGQALGLSAAIPPAVDGECQSSGTYALVLATTPLKVRWQYAQPNAVWHEALVTVPSFREASKPQGKVRSNEVHLFINPDSRVVAQRAQLLELSGDKAAIRFSAPAPAFDTDPPCGAADSHGPDVVRLAD